MKDLPITIQPCIRSGFCCKKAPCAYGEVDPKTGWCSSLREVSKIGDAPIYGCGRYDYIKTQPGWEFSPAFGGGCSSTLFNDDREKILRAVKERLG